MTERPPGLDALLDHVTAQLNDPANCGKCGHAFDPDDTRFDGRARYRGTLFCNRCVDNCHESSDAFHRCRVCWNGTGV